MKYRHFGKKDQKQALLRGLVLNMFKTGAIQTFRTRGKNAQSLIEEIINSGKKGDVNAQRKISSILATDRKMVTQIISISENFKDRISGYTRIIRLGQRKGDGSQMVRLEWVVDVKKKEEPKSTKTKSDSKQKGRREASLPVGAAA